MEAGDHRYCNSWRRRKSGVFVKPYGKQQSNPPQCFVNNTLAVLAVAAARSATPLLMPSYGATQILCCNERTPWSLLGGVAKPSNKEVLEYRTSSHMNESVKTPTYLT